MIEKIEKAMVWAWKAIGNIMTMQGLYKWLLFIFVGTGGTYALSVNEKVKLFTENHSICISVLFVFTFLLLVSIIYLEIKAWNKREKNKQKEMEKEEEKKNQEKKDTEQKRKNAELEFQNKVTISPADYGVLFNSKTGKISTELLVSNFSSMLDGKIKEVTINFDGFAKASELPEIEERSLPHSSQKIYKFTSDIPLEQRERLCNNIIKLSGRLSVDGHLNIVFFDSSGHEQDSFVEIEKKDINARCVEQ